MNVFETFQQRGKRECEDILKVFVINGPIFFPSSFLPEMPLGAENPSADLRGSNDQLSKFLSVLSGSIRVPGSAAGFEGKTEEWACRNFVIRTYI